MNNKHNIDDFYVGLLSVGSSLEVSPMHKSLVRTKLEKEVDKEINDLKKNGAKLIQRVDPGCWLNYADELSKFVKYKTMLTIFKKITDNEYLCLHDCKIYELDSVNRDRSNLDRNRDCFCRNLVSLNSLLPKTDYEKPEEITINEALDLYKKLYSKRFLYEDKELYDIKDFYIGDFEYCHGTCLSVIGDCYEYSPMLSANFMYETKHGCFFPERNNYRNSDNLYSVYTIKTLFLDKDNELINLYNNQSYPKKVTNIAKADESIIKTLESLTIKLDFNNIPYKDEKITINEALNKFKRIRK